MFWPAIFLQKWSTAVYIPMYMYFQKWNFNFYINSFLFCRNSHSLEYTYIQMHYISIKIHTCTGHNCIAIMRTWTIELLIGKHIGNVNTCNQILTDENMRGWGWVGVGWGGYFSVLFYKVYLCSIYVSLNHVIPNIWTKTRVGIWLLRRNTCMYIERNSLHSK